MDQWHFLALSICVMNHVLAEPRSITDYFQRITRGLEKMKPPRLALNWNLTDALWVIHGANVVSCPAQMNDATDIEFHVCQSAPSEQRRGIVYHRAVLRFPESS